MILANEAIKKAVIAADDARLNAMIQGDSAVAADALHDDLVFAHSSGRMDTKKTYVDGMRSGRYTMARKSDVTVYANGDTAWMLGRIELQVLRDGKQRDVDAQFLSV